MAPATLTQQDIINAQTSAKIDILAQEMKDFKDEMRDFKNEMRQQNAMRAAEISEIRKSVQSIQDSGRNQTIVTFLGIAAMVVAVLLK